MDDRFRIGQDGSWLSESEHGLDPKAVEAAAREFVMAKGDDPERMVYGRRLHADLSTSATCPMVPYHEFIAGHIIVAIRKYLEVAPHEPA